MLRQIIIFFCFFFVFKQKTAYEMRISDWSSDVCSSDLAEGERADARVALEALRGLGLRLHLSSGDGARAVQAFAARMGIAEPLSRQSPEDKLAYARRLQAQGRVVAMVGDGLNDPPVLAGADVSTAIREIVRAACRERGCPHRLIPVVSCHIKK